MLKVNAEGAVAHYTGYPCKTGLLEKESVELLQQFYVEGNPNGMQCCL